MPALIECVPNFSEGRDPEVIRRITARLESVEGATLLHVDPGKATNRTVVTFVGDARGGGRGRLPRHRRGRRADRHAAPHGRAPAHGRHRRLPAGADLRHHHGGDGGLRPQARRARRPRARHPGLPLRGGAARSRRGRTSPSSAPASTRGSRGSWRIRRGSPTSARRRSTRRAAPPSSAPATSSSPTTSTSTPPPPAAPTPSPSTCARRAARSARGTRSPARSCIDAAGQPVMVPGTLKAVKAIGWFIEEYGIAQVSMNLTDLRVTPAARGVRRGLPRRRGARRCASPGRSWSGWCRSPRCSTPAATSSGSSSARWACRSRSSSRSPSSRSASTSSRPSSPRSGSSSTGSATPG